MKAESRGKYPGTKIHLDEKESKQLVDWYEKYKQQVKGLPKLVSTSEGLIAEAIEICRIQAKVIKNLLAEHPDMLQERTPEQVQKALLKDQKKIAEQLTAMGSGRDWKAVK